MINERDLHLDRLYAEMETTVTKELGDIVLHFLNEFNIPMEDSLTLFSMWLDQSEVTEFGKDYGVRTNGEILKFDIDQAKTIA